MTAAEERALKSAVMQLHVNTGHPSNESLARAIRVTGGSQRAVEAALNVYCEVCAAHQRPQPHLPGRVRLDRDFNDSIGVDLFMLADYAGNQLIFINIVDLASGFTMVGTVATRHPTVVFARLLQVWITPFGAPTRVIFDGGGEFERELSKELEDMGCQLMTTAGATPQQNATVERHGGLFKTHARKLFDQFSIRFDKPEQAHKIQWMLASVCWAAGP